VTFGSHKSFAIDLHKIESLTPAKMRRRIEHKERGNIKSEDV